MLNFDVNVKILLSTSKDVNGTNVKTASVPPTRCRLPPEYMPTQVPDAHTPTSVPPTRCSHSDAPY